MKRVILDRSIFHGDKFKALKSSALSAAVARGSVSLFYTSMFLEETLMFALHRPEEFLEQWYYIVSLNDKRWFVTSDRILPIELGHKARRNDYYFMQDKDVRKTIMDVPRLARGRVPQNELNSTLNQVRRNYEIRNDFRSRVIELRKVISVGHFDFDTYFEDNVDWLIKEGVMRHHKNSHGFLKVWHHHRPELRFTEKYLRAWWSTIYLPLVDHQIKVDKNDKADADQLCFLEWADVFVSDDLGFVPRAFFLLYPAGDKTLLTSQDFIKQLEVWAPASLQDNAP